MSWRVRHAVAVAAAAALSAGVLGTGGSASAVPHPLVALAPAPAGPAAALSIRVFGNRLVNAAGATVQLRGVNRSGTEYACIQGWGIFDGPSDLASIQAIASWHANAVRIPLNEDCWLSLNGVKPAYSGASYRKAIVDYVTLLNSQRLYAILDLHWSAPGTTPATGQNPMPDADHSPAFWRSVASTFKSNPAVLFDLFNEPYPDNNQDSTAAWTCVRDGGTCPGVAYAAAGMQRLVTAVRNAGAGNVIMAAGVQYTNTLDRWLTYRPTDPAGQVAASVHVYDFNLCSSLPCWRSQYAPVAGQVPVISGEIGESGGSGQFVKGYMGFADTIGVSYLGWTWDTWGCSGGPVLISAYSGTACSGYGATYRKHLLMFPPPRAVIVNGR